MRVLGSAELKSLVPMSDAVELMKQVFALYSDGKTISPIRTPIELPGGDGVSLFMPAFVASVEGQQAALGAKIVSVFPGNVQQGMPTIHAVVITLDPMTGVPTGMIEGASVTALRTGAVSGAATDLMARKESRILTVIGAGAQGVTQAAAVCAVREIEEIRVIDPADDMRQTFAERLAGWITNVPSVNLDVVDARVALADSDIVCTATTSKTPVFEDAWIQDGTHINAVGAFTPEMQEIPDGTVARSRLVVDAVEAIMHEAGDIIQTVDRGVIARDDVRVELGHLVSGSASARENDSEVTFFKSVGNAIQDMVVARVALEIAESRGVGQAVSLT